MGKVLAAAVTAALVLSACTDDPPDVGFNGLPDPSESPEPSPHASAGAPDEIDVTTTPDEITPEWVTAVVNTILAEYGQMTAEILAMPVSDDPTLPDGFEERLATLFDGQYRAFAQAELVAALTDSHERDLLLPSEDFNGLRYDAEVVQVGSANCIVAVGRSDRSGSIPGGAVSDILSAVSLSPAPSSSPTAWVLRDLLVNTDSNDEPNPDEAMLEAELSDYGTALDHTCEVQS